MAHRTSKEPAKPTDAPAKDDKGRGRGRRGRGKEAEVAVDVRKKLINKGIINDPAGTTIYVCRFTPDNLHVAAGLSDGTVRIYNCSNCSFSGSFLTSRDSPVTALRFRPAPSPAARKVALTANADGSVQHWLYSRRKETWKSLSTFTEPNNVVYSVAYSSDGLQFCCAGRDKMVRIYDEITRQVLVTYGDGNEIGHENRVFATRFYPEDNRVLLSGGWDEKIQVWDSRMGAAGRVISGVQLGGEALDVAGNLILCGNWFGAWQIFDYGSGQPIEAPINVSTGHERCFIQTAAFSKANKGDMLLVGGSGSNDCKLYDRASKTALGSVTGLSKAVYSAEFSNTDGMVCAGGADGVLRLYDLVDM